MHVCRSILGCSLHRNFSIRLFSNPSLFCLLSKTAETRTFSSKPRKKKRKTASAKFTGALQETPFQCSLGLKGGDIKLRLSFTSSFFLLPRFCFCSVISFFILHLRWWIGSSAVISSLLFYVPVPLSPGTLFLISCAIPDNYFTAVAFLPPLWEREAFTYIFYCFLLREPPQGARPNGCADWLLPPRPKR